MNNTLANHVYPPQQPERPAAPIVDQERPTITRLKIMLHNRPNDTCPALEPHQIDRIPSKLLDTLLCEYQTEDYGDLGTVIKVSDDKHRVSIIRVVQWITKGKNADFLFPPTRDILKRNGDKKTVRFDAEIHRTDITYTTAQATMSCFAEEVESYVFSIQEGLGDLQHHMSKRLRSYPIYEHELKRLLTTLYSKGSKLAQVVDEDLARFIADRVQCLRSLLVADKSFIAVLRDCISPRQEIEILLQHGSVGDSIIKKALQAIRPEVNEADQADGLLRNFEEMHLNTNTAIQPNDTPSGPALDRRPSNLPANNEPNPASDAMRILDAIYKDKSLVRAEQLSVGTLIRSPSIGQTSPRGVNSDFRIGSGQFLVMLPERPRMYSHPQTRVFMNKDGDVGELYANYKLVNIQDIPPPPPPSSPASSEGAKRMRQ